MDQRFDVYRGTECVMRGASLRQAAELLKIDILDLALSTVDYGSCTVGIFSAMPSKDVEEQ